MADEKREYSGGFDPSYMRTNNAPATHQDQPFQLLHHPPHDEIAHHPSAGERMIWQPEHHRLIRISALVLFDLFLLVPGIIETYRMYFDIPHPAYSPGTRLFIRIGRYTSFAALTLCSFNIL